MAARVFFDTANKRLYLPETAGKELGDDLSSGDYVLIKTPRAIKDLYLSKEASHEALSSHIGHKQHGLWASVVASRQVGSTGWYMVAAEDSPAALCAYFVINGTQVSLEQQGSWHDGQYIHAGTPGAHPVPTATSEMLTIDLKKLAKYAVKIAPRKKQSVTTNALITTAFMTIVGCGFAITGYQTQSQAESIRAAALSKATDEYRDVVNQLVELKTKMIESRPRNLSEINEMIVLIKNSNSVSTYGKYIPWNKDLAIYADIEPFMINASWFAVAAPSVDGGFVVQPLTRLKGREK